MTYARRSWAEQRDSWKSVIFLNLARSVNAIVDVLVDELGIITNGIYSGQEDAVPSTPHVGLTEYHKSLTLKLAPLRQIERDLKLLLGPGSSEADNVPGAPYVDGRDPVPEFALRSTSGWKNVLDHIRNPSAGKDQQLQRVAYDVIVGLKMDIGELWNDVVVQDILQKRRMRLEDTPGL